MYNSLVNHIACAFDAMRNCEARGDMADMAGNHRDAIESLVAEHMPSGSGFDIGTRFDFDNSKPDRLIFDVGFHHMNEGGMYDGWTQHTVTVTPSFVFGFGVAVSGRNRNDIKYYIADVFHETLSAVVDNSAAYGREPATQPGQE